MSENQKTWIDCNDRPGKDDEDAIEKLVAKYPVRVFQVLNKRLNQDKFCILVDTLDL